MELKQLVFSVLVKQSLSLAFHIQQTVFLLQSGFTVVDQTLTHTPPQFPGPPLSLSVSPECVCPCLSCNRLLSESRCPDSTSPLRSPWKNSHTDTHKQGQPGDADRRMNRQKQNTEGLLDVGQRKHNMLYSLPGNTRSKDQGMLLLFDSMVWMTAIKRQMKMLSVCTSAACAPFTCLSVCFSPGVEC